MRRPQYGSYGCLFWPKLGVHWTRILTHSDGTHLDYCFPCQLSLLFSFTRFKARFSLLDFYLLGSFPFVPSVQVLSFAVEHLQDYLPSLASLTTESYEHLSSVVTQLYE